MARTQVALATILATTLLAAPAGAMVTVLGGSLAAACYRAAADNGVDREAMRVCNIALAEEGMTARDRAATFINRGVVHMNAHRTEEALRDFDTAIAMRPDLAEGFINRGHAQLRLRDYSGAVASITRGLALDPEDPARAYYNRGVANEELGDVRAAYNDYRQAATLSPRWEAPRTELVRFRAN